MGRTIAADVLDSRQNDWTISDDGINRGPLRTWPAPKLRHDDRNPALGPNATLTRSGLPDAYAFLRRRDSRVPFDALDDEESPDVPRSDVSGLPSYRVVPKPLSSLGYDVPGFDKYEAGLLVRFMRRTDAGALDGWAGCSGLECQGVLDVVHDAGMPAGWYDYFSQKEGEILGHLKKWGGAKFTPFHEKTIRDGFVGIRSHATDGSKWDYFNKAKPQSFAILQAVAGGPKYIWNNPTSQEQKVLNHIWHELENHVNSQGKGFIGSIGSAIGSVGSSVVSIAKGIATPVAGLVASPFKLASDIASGKNVFQSLKDTVKRDLGNVKDVAPYVQAAISVIPGVGAGVNAAIAAGAALANGQPITSALVAGLKNALPGGPIAAQAFDTAYAIARGQNVGEAALQALVNQVPGGALGKQAAQAAIAIAKGQNVQQAALTLVKGVAADKLGAIIPKDTPALLKTAITDLSQGKSVLETAKDAVGSTAMASFAKLSPYAVGVMNNAGPNIGNTVKAALPSILPNEVKMVASSLLATPALRNLPVEDLARKLNVSTHAVRDGMGAVLQAVQKSGGPAVPSLSYAKSLAARIPAGMSFDRAMPAFASKVAPKVWSHNVASPAAAAARLRRAGTVFATLAAHGLDCGALDPKSMPTLRQGSTGEPVKQWQKIIGVTADGQFGPNTTAATKAFQTKNKLVADGIVGLQSWTAGLLQVVTNAPPVTVPGTTIPISVPPPTTTAPIIAGQMPIIKRGSTGPAVKTWQTFLTIAADGIFGVNTESATKAFQTKNGLVSDGIVGPKTWEKAMSGTSAPTTGPSAPPQLPPQLPIPIPGLPPINLPPGLPPMPPLPPDFPPIVYPPPIGTTPPPPSMPPLPPGQPPMPPPPVPPPSIPPGWTPPIGTSPPPVYVPPGSGSGSGGGSALLIGGAVVLGAILLLGSGSQRNLT